MPFEGKWAIPEQLVTPDKSFDWVAEYMGETLTGFGEPLHYEQLHAFSDPDRDPRGRYITVAYCTLVRSEDLPEQLPKASDDEVEASWLPAYELPPLALDHDHILSFALQRLRSKLEYTTIGFQLLPDEFTLSELQEFYEAILNRRLDKRNFRKKLLAMVFWSRRWRRARSASTGPLRSTASIHAPRSSGEGL